MLYRSAGRADSCDKTINNTMDSIMGINNKSNNASQVTNYQNFQAMQMAIHNGRSGRIGQIAHGLIRHSEKKPKDRISLPVIGRVHATQDTRTGILTKTRTRSLRQTLNNSKADLV